MTNGTLAAMIISDLVEGTANPWAETFDSTRTGLGHGLVDVVSAGIDFAKHFVGDRIGPIFRTADDLPSGTGAVVLSDGQKVAAFRDDAGELHTVSATCSHLGCLVSFNTAERSWDCPCHGSRFDIDGNVLHGPATKSLAVKEPGSESSTDEEGDTEFELT
jgi:Rieske Fe-S protein